MKSPIAKMAIVLLLAPVLLVVLLLGLVMTDAEADPCSNDFGPGLSVDPAQVPKGPIAGYKGEQLVNAAIIMVAGNALGLSRRDQQIGVMTAMGESSLVNIDRGDEAGPDSRGLFQQRDNGAWGTYQDRMTPSIAATNFFKAMMKIQGREGMEPTAVAHKTQRNADPFHYAPYWGPAGEVMLALAGVQPKPTVGPEQGQGKYNLGKVKPHTQTVANTLGAKFEIENIGGYRDAGAEKYDQNGHPAGLALDFMVYEDKAKGDALAAYIQANATQLGVKYQIWYQRIWSVDRASEGWRPMADRGSPTQNHLDHVHLSLNATPGSGGASDPGCGQGGAVSQTGWAAPSKGPQTSGYGPRSSPGGVGSTWHKGIDLAPGCDQPIWAANAGTVVKAGPASGFGNVIIIDHGEGVITRYGHMYPAGLLTSAGTRVQAGQQIARIGSAGASTGCHLHFEVEINGAHVDPNQFLSKVNVKIT